MSSSTQLTMSTRFEELSWSQPHGSNVLNTYRRWKNLNLEPQPLVVFTPFYIVAFIWILSDKSALSECFISVFTCYKMPISGVFGARTRFAQLKAAWLYL